MHFFNIVFNCESVSFISKKQTEIQQFNGCHHHHHLFIFLIVGFILLFVPLIISQANNLALLDTAHLQTNFIEAERHLEDYFNIQHIDLNKVIKDSKLTSVLDFSYFTGFINSIINFMANMGMGLVSVFLLLSFLLKTRTFLKIRLEEYYPIQMKTKY